MGKIKAIADCRVSSDEQLANNSLKRQKASVIKYAKDNDLELVKIWSQAVSSKNGTNLKRPDLVEMRDFCRKEKGIEFIIFDEPDRFARSQDEAMWWKVEFKQLGVKIKFASDPDLDMDDAFGKFRTTMDLFRAEQENASKSRKTRSGLAKALMEGRYPFSPPIGYTRSLNPAVYDLDPDVAPYLQIILKKLAKGEVTPNEALREFNSIPSRKGMKVYCMDKGKPLFCNSYYAGVVEKHTDCVDIRNEKGLHTPLITLQEHQKILGVFEGHKKRNSGGGGRIGLNDLFPLSNMIYCEGCKKNKTKYNKFVGIHQGNRAKSNPNAKFYDKYRCRGCNKYLNSEEVHRAIKELIKGLEMDEPTRKKFINKCSEIWKRCEEDTEVEKAMLKKQATSLDKEIDELTVACAKRPSSRLEKIIKDKESSLDDLNKRIEGLEKVKADEKEKFISFAIDFVNNLAERFFEIKPEKRVLCKKLLFPGDFAIDQNNFVYTPQISPIFRGICNKNEADQPQNIHYGTPGGIRTHDPLFRRQML